MDMNNAATPEPAPQDSEHPDIANIVVDELRAMGLDDVAADVIARKEFGMKKYGTPLRAFNGRDALNDLYQELLDGLNYAEQAICEIIGKPEFANTFAKDAKRYWELCGVFNDLAQIAGKVKTLNYGSK